MQILANLILGTICSPSTAQGGVKKKPGFTRFSSYGRLVYAGWFDKKAVHVLSNCHQPIGDDTVEHWYNAKKGERPTIF